MSATVDDNAMGVTHVIRGDDHKINSFKQKQIYESMNWKIPEFAHIPLIHSEKGKKLSKRDNASTLDDYMKIGIMPDALRNYLLRLGWSYKDKEIFSLQESIDFFDFKGIGKSPSKLDYSRILSINETYIKSINEDILFDRLVDFTNNYKKPFKESKLNTLKKSISFLKNKAKTLQDIYNNCQFIILEEIKINKEEKELIDKNSKLILTDFINDYKKINDVKRESSRNNY